MIVEFADHPYYSPATFPVGGEKFHFANGKEAPVYTDWGLLVEAEDGSQWSYKGISGYEVDNRDRIKGWQRVKPGRFYN